MPPGEGGFEEAALDLAERRFEYGNLLLSLQIDVYYVAQLLRDLFTLFQPLLLVLLQLLSLLLYLYKFIG